MKELKKVKLIGKIWYEDLRLRQYREVTNPHNFLSFKDMRHKVDKLIYRKRAIKEFLGTILFFILLYIIAVLMACL